MKLLAKVLVLLLILSSIALSQRILPPLTVGRLVTATDTIRGAKAGFVTEGQWNDTTWLLYSAPETVRVQWRGGVPGYALGWNGRLYKPMLVNAAGSIDSLYKKTGTDSIFYVINDTVHFAYKDSTGGTVTSVGMTVPTLLAVAGSPITSSGTLAVTWSGLTQGDIVYASAGNTMVVLPKSTGVDYFLSNKGTNNNPQWDDPLLLLKMVDETAATPAGAQSEVTPHAGTHRIFWNTTDGFNVTSSSDIFLFIKENDSTMGLRINWAGGSGSNKGGILNDAFQNIYGDKEMDGDTYLAGGVFYNFGITTGSATNGEGGNTICLAANTVTPFTFTFVDVATAQVGGSFNMVAQYVTPGAFVTDTVGNVRLLTTSGNKMGGANSDELYLGRRADIITAYPLNSQSGNNFVMGTMNGEPVWTPGLEVRTTDATEITIAKIPHFSATATYELHVNAKQSASNNGASYNYIYTYDASGAQIGTTTTVHVVESDATWNAYGIVQGGYFLVRIQGKAATTIDWSWSLLRRYARTGN